MKLMIDISEEDYNECKFRKDLLSLGGEPTDLTFNMRIETLISNGTPLEDIKAEIEHFASDDTTDEYQNGAIDMRDYVLRVIDKYIEEE